MKLLTASQIGKVDVKTIQKENIKSIDLMECAAKAFCNEFTEHVGIHTSIAIICGPGNNGGDGLAVARLLLKKGYTSLSVWADNFSGKYSPDRQLNLKRLRKLNIQLYDLTGSAQISKINASVLVDALLGSGFKNTLRGLMLDIVKEINKLPVTVYSIDVPTGFLSEGIFQDGTILRSDTVISFELPKINFFFPESAKAIKAFTVVNIGLNKEFIRSLESGFTLTELADVIAIYKPRRSFSHKGTYGHALIVAGSEQTMGAALLTAEACLHTGAGLTTACIPDSGLNALNTSLPEVMYMPQSSAEIKKQKEKFNAIAIGPGLGDSVASVKILNELLSFKSPLILDADALNIISQEPKLLDLLVEDTILTPHVKEFDRVFGVHSNWWERVATARKEAVLRKLVIVLKNQYTFIASPDGMVHINETGNPGMAGGGMGDVLTGVITSLVAQGYSALNAAIMGCYLHGRAGDVLAEKCAVVTASDVAKQLSRTLKVISDKC
ncbi:MAG: NAD(P)H-hydrate dehydratase [Pedobacter sp.]|nr:MAG: NAD(P)H-hydrate dehydratase [Pedobacter sp.]